MRNIVYFDLETQRSFRDVNNNKSKMGVSIAVTYSTKNGSYMIYDEAHMKELIEELSKADLVVGFNHISFDYAVLQAYAIFDLLESTHNIDMLVDVEKTLGHRLKLDSIASASLGTGKTADGLDALRWWQEHKKTGSNDPIMKIAEYCAYDVKCTKEVYEYGVKNGYISYEDRTGKIQQMSVNWKL